MPHHGQRPRRIYGRNIHGTREPQPRPLRGNAVRRTAHHDDRNRELSRIPGRHHHIARRESAIPRLHAEQRRFACYLGHRHRCQSGGLSLHPDRGRRPHRRSRVAHRSHRRIGQIPRTALRKQIQGNGRERMRHLRRFLLPRTGRSRGGRPKRRATWPTSATRST